MALKILDRVPERGFYYSYKHDPTAAVNNNAFYVFGVGYPTTDKNAEPQVVYLPLDENSPVYKAGRSMDLKEINDWFSDKEKDGQKVERYQKITDPETIKKLSEVLFRMYDVSLGE